MDPTGASTLAHGQDLHIQHLVPCARLSKLLSFLMLLALLLCAVSIADGIISFHYLDGPNAGKTAKAIYADISTGPETEVCPLKRTQAPHTPPHTRT